MRHACARIVAVAALGFGVLPALAGAPARADVGPSKDISITGVGYTCKATNAVLDTAVGGPQTFLVNARTTVPTSIAGGDTIPATKATLDLTLPATLVAKLNQLSVKTVAGSADASVLLEGVASNGSAVGALNEPVQGLSSTAQNVPASGTMTISDVTGTVNSFTAPSFPSPDDVVYVELPLHFQLHALLSPPVLGAVSQTDMDCYRLEDTSAARVIGTIQVGSGCSATACPLPAVDRSGVPSWVPAPSSGGTGPGGTNPSSPTSTAPITPVQPGNPNAPVDPVQPIGTTPTTGTNTNPSTHHAPTGVSDPGTSDVVATTTLPDTGSPIAPWLFAVLGAAIVARVALLIRQRRRHRH